MPKRKLFYLLNWDKYQARSDKELPWVKLWGSLFDKPWWQDLDDKFKAIPVIFLDCSRRFNNKMPSEWAYFARNYALKMAENEWVIICNLLIENEFLSDTASDIQDKTRQDKSRGASPTALLNNNHFDVFYKAYPKKRSRGDAEKAWKTLRCDEDLLGLILGAIEKQKKSENWIKNNGQFIPYPASWLRARGWEDEVECKKGDDIWEKKFPGT